MRSPFRLARLARMFFGVREVEARKIVREFAATYVIPNGMPNHPSLKNLEMLRLGDNELAEKAQYHVGLVNSN